MREAWHVRHASSRLTNQSLSRRSFDLSELVDLIRDAVELARFLVETTIGFVKFSVARPKTVGGSIPIAAMTKHEGFQWVQRQKGFGDEKFLKREHRRAVAAPGYRSLRVLEKRVSRHSGGKIEQASRPPILFCIVEKNSPSPHG